MWMVSPANRHLPSVVCSRTNANISCLVLATEVVEERQAAVSPDCIGYRRKVRRSWISVETLHLMDPLNKHAHTSSIVWASLSWLHGRHCTIL